MKEIADKINFPTAFTAKILHQLAENHILISTKGSLGGFQIKKKRKDDIELAGTVFAIDAASI